MANISHKSSAGTVLLLLALFCAVPAKSATNDPVSSSQGLTNLSSFTGSYLKLPAPDAVFPEVQEAFRPDPFRDVYEADDESPWRRLEVVSVISFPPLFLIGNIVVRVVHMIRTDSPTLDMLSDLSTTENLALYGSTIAASGLIGLNDYRLVRNQRRKEGIEWSLWKKRF
jgi:hypothetical protein